MKSPCSIYSHEVLSPLCNYIAVLRHKYKILDLTQLFFNRDALITQEHPTHDRKNLNTPTFLLYCDHII